MFVYFFNEATLVDNIINSVDNIINLVDDIVNLLQLFFFYFNGFHISILKVVQRFRIKEIKKYSLDLKFYTNNIIPRRKSHIHFSKNTQHDSLPDVLFTKHQDLQNLSKQMASNSSNHQTNVHKSIPKFISSNLTQATTKLREILI